ncbi:MAG: ribonucleoside-diphosphate reductase, adenosylcobalamin-dependent [Elusimicrobia bacterium RIFCSPLOWO2_01_FULL_64_13]|nr:MAG: ribonucleoside-diphosphate reductase, adenosylcobalamin-dependent [Elusimicrobia bacterium RIFCSPHIGHO2_01_FULL_64_10]OGR94031.1 MAG: ribonucleoside-diphosphate reductase, adenosylcobalamin-dependent [Elusimicrobia bacterium RIFCSPLOWO2_01_FULL_64_13]
MNQSVDSRSSLKEVPDASAAGTTPGDPQPAKNNEEELFMGTAPLTQETSDFFKGDILRSRVFLDKYALRDRSGRVVEKTPLEMWSRVARELASVEKTEAARNEWQEKFYWLLSDFRFIPGGRILFGAGNPRNVTLLNCYVIPVKEDRLEAIFEWMKEAARTYSYGGGVGTDISGLRPKGSRVNNAALTSTGSVSFMDLFSLTTGTIGQAGRRGALMITMADSHPDILDFCKVKRNLKSVRYANISVRVSDALMRAVEKDADFELHFENEKVRVSRTIRARELWDELIRGAHSWAEPGIIFWDTIKRESTSEYDGMGVISTNPCAEIPLEGYGDCCLGNINFSKFVEDEFTEKARVNWVALEKAARTGVRFLDNVLDYNADKHPLASQTEASMTSRRVGLGFTGLGDMLCQLRLKYDTDAAIGFVDTLFERIKNFAYDESVNLGVEKGTFKKFNADKHMRSPFIQRLRPEVRERVRAHGLRNVALLTVPPVGSGASLAGTTSGVEPIFDLSYTRRSESLSQEYFKVYHPLVAHYMQNQGASDESGLPEYFVTSHNITAEKRVLMQATIQKHIDHAISSTVNLPRETTAEEVSRIYQHAWKMGCKGITVYREGSREGVLISDDESKRKGAGSNTALQAKEAAPPTRTRPKVTEGRTERVESPRGPIYVTINEDELGICEIFVKSLDAEAEVTGRLASLLLRAGVDPREIMEQLWRVRSREVAFDRSVDGTTVCVTTVAQGVALVIGRYLYGDAYDPKKEYPRATTLPEPPKAASQLKLKFSGQGLPQQPAAPAKDRGGAPPQEIRRKKEFAGICPDCGEPLIHENGCDICKHCSYSRCG